MENYDNDVKSQNQILYLALFLILALVIALLASCSSKDMMEQGNKQAKLLKNEIEDICKNQSVKYIEYCTEPRSYGGCRINLTFDCDKVRN